MQIADGWLYINKLKSDVPVKGITPAELVLLVKDRQDTVGTFPVHDLVIRGTMNRTSATERNRLGQKYGRPVGEKKTTKVEQLYPGENAQLPETFDETGMHKQAAQKLLGEPVPHPDDVKPEVVEELVDA